MTTKPDDPNPGSPEAIAAGCICPRMDNNYGKGYGAPVGRSLFIFNDNCPLHGKERKDKD